MYQLPKLNIGVDENEIYFTENEELVEYLRKYYPNLTFKVTLSLSDLPHKNLHSIEVQNPPLILNHGLFDPTDAQTQAAIIDGLMNLLDNTVAEMAANKIKSATVHLSRISIGVVTHPIALKRTLYANLRACFIKD